jgi:hypothetical protein
MLIQKIPKALEKHCIKEVVRKIRAPNLVIGRKCSYISRGPVRLYCHVTSFLERFQRQKVKRDLFAKIRVFSSVMD